MCVRNKTSYYTAMHYLASASNISLCVLDAGGVILLVLLILIALMLYRWKARKDPLPPRVRTIYNRTFRGKKSADNELYGVNSQPMANVVKVQNSRPNVIQCSLIDFIS